MILRKRLPHILELLSTQNDSPSFKNSERSSRMNGWSNFQTYCYAYKEEGVRLHIYKRST